MISTVSESIGRKLWPLWSIVIRQDRFEGCGFQIAVLGLGDRSPLCGFGSGTLLEVPGFKAFATVPGDRSPIDRTLVFMEVR